MSAHAHAIAAEDHDHPVGSTRLFSRVWLWLLLLTAVEVFLAYERLAPVLMLTILVGLSLIKSALIIAYFMHLKFERLGLFLVLIPAMVFCICMMLIWFFPDSVRLMHMHSN
jgi:cytochrome c oxidase subunit IV